MNLMTTIAGLLVISVAPDAIEAPSVARQRVDMIELNHFIDDQGREVFRQVIFYDWSKPEKQFHVRAWRLIKKPSQLPERRWNPDQYQCTWHDEGILRHVWAPSMRETWTQRDPERVNRALLPEDQRIPLWTPKIATKQPTTR
ncbi:hypothetical protein [Stieleria marina]|uniref:Uncharacterized protein n=1 Tax=Stieleria marina TaxID=1930275 RepID=A0A517NQ92_9BACT|nr:hypothetical protein K239x_12400 [Planctomycetes bacterium K23_9]